MRRNNVYGRLLSIVLAATLALSPATTSLAASVEDTGLYGAIVEEGEVESNEETAKEDAVEEATEGASGEEVSDEAESGSSKEDEEEAADESETGASDEVLVEDEIESEEADEASSLDSTEDAETKSTSDDAAESKLSGSNSLMGAVSTPKEFPSGATAQGDPKEVGVNVLGQLYTWTAEDGKHTGLYIYGDGTTINKPIWSVFNTEYKTITDLEFWPDVLGIEGYAFDLIYFD